MSPDRLPVRAALEHLCRRRGVELAYTDVRGARHRRSSETLAAVLAALGEPIASPSDAPEAWAAANNARSTATLPLVIAWDGVLPPLPRGAHATRSLRLLDERGEDLAPLGRGRAGGGRTPLPYGVHELRVGALAVPVIAAPALLPTGFVRSWGLAAPAYALRDERDRAAGDLESLRRLGSLVASLGGSVVATLPLLADYATADGAPPGQRPYSPVSRLFWNEAYLDPDRCPELAGASWEEPAPRRGRADLARLATALRPALDAGAAALERGRSSRRHALRAFVARRPEVLAYARFRAAVERQGIDRHRWPAHWRDGSIPASELDARAVARHVYAQFALDTQLGEDAARLGSLGVGYLLDLPVGCRPDGFDPFAHPAAFSTGATIGAPPDAFFAGGQDWGLPAPQPVADRPGGHRHFRACFAHSARHARALRLDHVMALSRLWWVPRGMAPSEGAYVRYPTEELLAAACLEAWRHGTHLVGEDLGTVEPALRARLRRHGIARSYVALFDCEAAPGRRLKPSAGSVAAVTTHDTPTFAGWADGTEIEERAQLGLLGAGAARRERSHRRRTRVELTRRLARAGLLDAKVAEEPGPGDLLAALLDELGRGPAGLVLVGCDDLAGSSARQNLPGTTGPTNFVRRLPVDVERLGANAGTRRLLARLAESRAEGPAGLRGASR